MVKRNKVLSTILDLPDGKLRLSHNKINVWQACHLKYRYIYIDRLFPKEERAYPLQVGDIVHRLLKLYRDGELTPSLINNLEKMVATLYPDNTDETVLNVAADAVALVQGYINQFKDDLVTFISTEVHLQVEFKNYYLYGIIDGLARPEDNKLWRAEYKTTGKMDSYYLNGLKGGLQGAIYDYLVEQTMKEEVKGTIYDLLVKTKIPSYHRAYATKNREAVKRMLNTVEGVYNEIKRGEYYPSSRCFSYNRECEYLMLCNNDNEQTRQSFYKVVEEDELRRKEVKVAGNGSD